MNLLIAAIILLLLALFMFAVGYQWARSHMLARQRNDYLLGVGICGVGVIPTVMSGILWIMFLGSISC